MCLRKVACKLDTRNQVCVKMVLVSLVLNIRETFQIIFMIGIVPSRTKGHGVCFFISY
jgi:hypothetical protein